METTEIETDVLDQVKEAISYALRRIQQDENIRYHMGAFTQAFDNLAEAHASLNSTTVEEVEKEVLTYQLKRMPYGEILKEVKAVLARASDVSASHALREIAEIIEQA